jgi:hypothetical protein
MKAVVLSRPQGGRATGKHKERLCDMTRKVNCRKAEQRNRPVRDPHAGVVWEGRRREAPPYPDRA